MVANVAPDGTPLVLTDVAGEIVLPNGKDGVPGSFDAPGDDPLRLARIEGIGVLPVVSVVQPGADGQLGTSDDLPVIGPQQMGDGEFLVEGLLEGTHTFEIDLNATLEGLPSGPVKLSGKSAGAVLVRNPDFSISLAHPRTIRVGETYELFATVTNTSRTPGNLVSVHPTRGLPARSATLLSVAT